jgi:ATP-binding cassette subfamily B (MDR/TAP) protein 1
VSTIRTAQAFGTQHALASLYEVVIQKAYQAECRVAVTQGVGLGIFFFVVYAAYGLGEFNFLVCPPAQLIPAR